MNRYSRLQHLTQETLQESDKRTRKCHVQKRLEVSSQSHRHIFKSGPTKETIEFRKHESGESMTRVPFHSFVGGGGVFRSLRLENC